jgi:hypothetical protein
VFLLAERFTHVANSSYESGKVEGEASYISGTDGNGWVLDGCSRISRVVSKILGGEELFLWER